MQQSYTFKYIKRDCPKRYRWNNNQI
ncbi:hypothetical protein SPTP3101_p51 [Staphylococcus phage tp310-1]|uniref:Uncharacterized protein n=1 Tax=Staphylococcus phage tp310-1 TaxID=445515 RepID=A7TWD6_9CAUD|nr:hypothetical protein SPTP3101_p51 [Staphylococcus phage tp310-1]ABS87453.1 hypothetical protein [Staphylococcus phage tp310-1]